VIKYIGGEGTAKTTIIIKKNKTLTLIKIRLLDEISKNNTNNIGDLIFPLEGYAPHLFRYAYGYSIKIFTNNNIKHQSNDLQN
jgi:hypothetical protein